VRRSFVAIAGLAFVLSALGGSTSAQRPLDSARGRQSSASSPSARDAAPIDLTGYWVSYVTENWRYRMVTPAKGEYRRIPASPAALPIINAWDPSADERAGNQCKSYGAGTIMTVPGRLHITWQDGDTLRIDTDAGRQTRLFRFTARAAGNKPAPPTWQGESTARWERVAAAGSTEQDPAYTAGGSLRVVTSNMRAGYLRKNGVPYSERATVSEHFDVTSLPDGGGELLLVTTVVEDPVYLNAPYITSPHFKREPDGSKWEPTPCSSTW
jgi:hypothetical protein